MPAADLQKIVRDFQNFGETTNMSVTKGGVTFTTSGDIGKGDVVVKPRDSEKETDRVEVSCTEPVQADFSTRYLNFFTKATSLSSQSHSTCPTTRRSKCGTILRVMRAVICASTSPPKSSRTSERRGRRSPEILAIRLLDLT